MLSQTSMIAWILLPEAETVASNFKYCVLNVPAGTVTGAVANFTYPGTTGASCTVTYSVCAPAPRGVVGVSVPVTGS